MATAFAYLANESTKPIRAVLADVDVDAANLELVKRPTCIERPDFTGGSLAAIHLMIVDGPTGIGYPVIAAAAGADLVCIVTESGVSGVHDLRRILQTVMHFHIPALVVVNKANICPQGAQEIEAVCAELGVGCMGQSPFDPAVTEAMGYGEPVTAYRAQAISSQAREREEK